MNDLRLNRRDSLRVASASALAGITASEWTSVGSAQAPSALRAGVNVIHPRGRIPLSFIIDDSTCLVNMGHFCMPQFAEAWPEREIYKQPWRDWPREIPDAFVREFGEWCSEQGVKGKYSIVPNPACVGWLDRNLPGWSKRDLEASIALVRELMTPNWDIHPEMITHTRVIDLKTGRPVEGANAATMENSYPQADVSTDYLAEYLAYALRILKNCGLPCEGITTPGGFGNRVKDKLPVAVHQAVRDVFGSELPHYFKYVVNGDESTDPKWEYNGAETIHNLTMNVPAGTGDWFGSWEGVRPLEDQRYCNDDASAGRMVELIEAGRPAVMLCHWPGMYCNGTKEGFHAFQRVVTTLASRFGDETIWMKVSEIGRYWAAMRHTKLTRKDEQTVSLDADLACEDFTFEVSRNRPAGKAEIRRGEEVQPLREVPDRKSLTANSFVSEESKTVFCVRLPKGESQLTF